MKKMLILIDKVLSGILVCIVLAQVFVLIISIFWRFILNDPIMWTDEVIRYLLVWVSFLGLGAVTKEHKQIVVTAIDSHIPARLSKILDIMVDIVMIVFFCVLVYWGAIVAAGEMAVRGQTIAWLRFGYIYAAIPIGCAIAIGYLIRKLYLYTKGQSKGEDDIA
jgi:TRAP-type C4-dicarboxylate transport system permease small subunit